MVKFAVSSGCLSISIFDAPVSATQQRSTRQARLLLLHCAQHNEQNQKLKFEKNLQRLKKMKLNLHSLDH